MAKCFVLLAKMCSQMASFWWRMYFVSVVGGPHSELYSSMYHLALLSSDVLTVDVGWVKYYTCGIGCRPRVVRRYAWLLDLDWGDGISPMSGTYVLLKSCGLMSEVYTGCRGSKSKTETRFNLQDSYASAASIMAVLFNHRRFTC